jgi:hypothetical protein
VARRRIGAADLAGVLSHSGKVDFNLTFTEIAKMLMFQQVAARAADCGDSI